MAKADVTGVQIEAKFVNPEDGNNLLSDKSSTLSQALSRVCELEKSQPSIISVIPGDGQVTLTWQAQGDPLPIEGYLLRYWEGDDYINNPPKPPLGAQGNGNPLGRYNQGNVFSGTNATITGLVNGKTYTFGVTAYEPYRCGYGWEVYISATPKAP